MDSIVLDRYQILQSLSMGGFSETFLAIDLQSATQQKVVLKCLKPTHDRITPEISEKLFLREASVLEELGSSCTQIPSLYAYICENDRYYLVQEYIEGQNLLELGIITPSQCFSILSSLLDTLKFIHSRNIIHRDIKPENIIIRQSDRLPVLIDFGAVKETMGTSLNASIDPSVPSVIVGTQCFMAPEQSTDRTVFSTDLYALGLTMIYSLTGKLHLELTSDPVTGELEWQEGIVDLDDNLKRVLNRAIRMEVQNRYSTAEAMSEDLHLKTSTRLAYLPTNDSETIFARAANENSDSVTSSTRIAIEDSNSSSQKKNNSLFDRKILLVMGLFGLIATLLAYLLVSIDRTNEDRLRLAQIEEQKAEIEALLAEQRQKTEEEQIKRQKAEELRIEAEKQRQKAEQLRKLAQIEANKQRRLNSILVKSEGEEKTPNAVVGGIPGRKNIRSGPGTNYRVVGTAYTGEPLQITGSGQEVNGYIWYQIYHPQSETEGWMASHLVDF